MQKVWHIWLRKWRPIKEKKISFILFSPKFIGLYSKFSNTFLIFIKINMRKFTDYDKF
jgi:hypothetical protein